MCINETLGNFTKVKKYDTFLNQITKLTQLLNIDNKLELLITFVTSIEYFTIFKLITFFQVIVLM